MVSILGAVQKRISLVKEYGWINSDIVHAYFWICILKSSVDGGVNFMVNGFTAVYKPYVG